MKVIQQYQGGYSLLTTSKYIVPALPIYSLSTELEVQRVFENGRPTNEIQAYKVWFVQEGLEPFQVKFLEEIELPDFLSVVEFDNLEACEIKRNVYFRANGINEVK